MIRLIQFYDVNQRDSDRSCKKSGKKPQHSEGIEALIFLMMFDARIEPTAKPRDFKYNLRAKLFRTERL